MSENRALENPMVSAEAELAAAPEGDAPAAVADDESWVLDLGDLIADAQGEVVVGDMGGAQLTITAASSVASQGQAEGHVTQDGVDVSGLQFVTFENGITLYYDDGVHLSFAG
jgi:hypothetical protein